MIISGMQLLLDFQAETDLLWADPPATVEDVGTGKYFHACIKQSGYVVAWMDFVLHRTRSKYVW